MAKRLMLNRSRVPITNLPVVIPPKTPVIDPYNGRPAAQSAWAKFQVHPHMLRCGCGYKLANQGVVDTRSLQHYLGHKNIQHTVRYSELSPNRFKDFWRD
jgi:integrase